MLITEHKERLWEKHYARFVLVSFWFIGACNSMPFVIMLSAAHDLLQEKAMDAAAAATGKRSLNSTSDRYDCNKLSTGIVLLADILPGLCLQLIAPFFIQQLRYAFRVLIVASAITTSFLLLALTATDQTHLKILGVMFSSFASRLGEMTFLGLLTLYPTKYSLTGWASGTGFAGLFGSFIYAELTSLGWSPNRTILFMLVVPIIMCVSFYALPSQQFALMRSNREKEQQKKEKNKDGEVMELTESVKGASSKNYASIQNSEQPPDNAEDDGVKFEDMPLYEKLKALSPLFKYMIPLCIVYFSEYFINQGLFELIYFPNTFIRTRNQQYRYHSSSSSS